MIRFISLIVLAFFILSSWPSIENQIQHPEMALDRVQTELNSLMQNPEVMAAAKNFFVDFQDLIKATWVLIREIKEDNDQEQPNPIEAESVSLNILYS